MAAVVVLALTAAVALQRLASAEQVSHSPFAGVTHVVRHDTTPRAVTMNIVLINLTTPGIRFKVTAPAGRLETIRQTTLAFLEQEGAQIAINAHFFLPFPPDPDASLIGLAASEGRRYSEFEPIPCRVRGG